MSGTTRAYNSPLREKKARQTREAILDAFYALMCEANAPDEIGMESIAQKAGVQRRTIFRHFATREELLCAFWPWLNAKVGASPAPHSVRDVVDGPREAFPRFDAHEPAMRAALHSRTGREMRLNTVTGRRALFAGALEPVLYQLPPAEARKVEALAHLLFSASAWEVLKDYGGLTGAQAGESASWALELILSAVDPSHAKADVPSQTKEKER
jgi:hypothetical protein